MCPSMIRKLKVIVYFPKVFRLLGVKPVIQPKVVPAKTNSFLVFFQI